MVARENYGEMLDQLEANTNPILTGSYVEDLYERVVSEKSDDVRGV